MSEQQAPAPSPSPSVREWRAVVRIDDKPGGKKFQGVWLEFPDGKRWVIDYRPRTPWTWFANAEVVVTGGCYEPFGQAIGANHFRVDRMRFAAAPAAGTVPYLELGPERALRGRFTEHFAPPGSKLAGTVETRFVEDSGTAYGVAGIERARPPLGDHVRIDAREVTPDRSYSAQTGGPKLWVLTIRDPDAVDDPAHAPRDITCPG